MSPTPKNIVVVGAGVSGLTSALLLARDSRLAGSRIAVLAKHMPGDYDIEYCSPWAGANYLPVGKPGTPHQKYERETWPELERLAKEVAAAGIHFQESVLHRRAKDDAGDVGDWFRELLREDAWFKDVVPNFRVLDPASLPEGVDGGTAFTSVCINTALYLPWLTSQLLSLGVTFHRAELPSLSSLLFSAHGHPDIIVNCTALGSLSLTDVADKTLYPARGQIVLVRNTPAANRMLTTSGTDDGPDEAMYIMTRAAGGGTILGGCLQKDSWDAEPDMQLAERIMRRAVAACPDLVKEGEGVEGLSVVRHGVGLRPMRKGGMRVERETRREGGREVQIVHNYGHGGYGYQTSYGCAQEVLRLVADTL